MWPSTLEASISRPQDLPQPIVDQSTDLDHPVILFRYHQELDHLRLMVGLLPPLAPRPSTNV